LPAGAPEPPPGPNAGEVAAGQADTGAREVLLVDDDRDFADSLAALLELEGYAVEVAYGFDQTLEAAARRRPAVALVDIRLGQHNGVELVRELRRRHPDLIAVMMTAYTTIEATVGALQAGAYDYLCKPFHTDDLLATLERCFERLRLHAERERAMAALEARNRELESLNARLTRVLSSVHTLSRAEGLTSAGQTLLAIVIRELSADGGVVYVRDGERLARQAAEGGAYAATIALPLSPDSWLAEGFAQPGPAVRMTSGSPPGLCSSNRADCPGPTLVLSLADGADVLGLVVVHTHESRGFTQQDIEIAQILASFGAAVMRVARVSESLAHSETRLRDVVANSPSAISLTDLEGNPIVSNERFVAWFPRGVPEQVDPAEGAAGLDAEAPGALSGVAVIAHGQAVTREIEVVPEGEARRRLLVTRFPVHDGGGGAIGVGTIATDVTERHLAEERLRQAQRMEAVGQLTGGIAHDFNNLLAVVLGNLRLLEEESADRPELLELIEDALEAAHGGVELTGRLLAFGRVQPLHPEITDVRELVLTMSRLLGRTLGEDITIQLTLAPDLWHVKIDRRQLEAGLLNLAINARDAMAGGGRLAIAVHNAILDAADVRTDPEAQAGRYVALSVADDGVGMAADVRERAVQPFFTTKSAGRGSGLGLSMVYGFVKQSGGHLHIESEPGRGTTVTLYFPAMAEVPVETAPCRAPAMPPPAGRGERVLLVEDQPQVRLLLKRQISRLGFAVVDVADADAALARLCEPGDVDVLLTDVVLPGEMNGIHLCEAALARDPNLGVILTTGYTTDVLAERPGPLAAADILKKPVDPETLARSLCAAIERRTGASPRIPASAATHSADGENT